MQIGYHCSHEQFSPRALLDYVAQAEKAGFQSFMSSDHFAPWSARQGESGFCWSWLGAALQATNVPFGSLAIPGGWRYHPAVLAQAIATLAQMFPGRLPWVAAGSGEALNEHITGTGWPPKAERNQRLLIGISVMRALWRGETVTIPDGPLKTHEARLWTLPSPEYIPKIYGAALSEETASGAGAWADGLITIRKEKDELAALLAAFRAHGGHGKPLVLQLQISWDESYEKALHNVWHQWRSHALEADDLANLKTPAAFDKKCAGITPAQIDGLVPITTDPHEIAAWIADYKALGFDALYLHNAGRNQSEFITMCRDELFPLLRGRSE